MSDSGRQMAQAGNETRRCANCGTEWTGDNRTLPRTCPKCESDAYDIPGVTVPKTAMIPPLTDAQVIARLKDVRELPGLERYQRDALDAALQRLQGWQPIETAPKDGTPILVRMPDWSSGNIYQTRWIDAGITGGWEGIYNPDPKHWQPLPTPPAPGSARPTEAK